MVSRPRASSRHNGGSTATQLAASCARVRYVRIRNRPGSPDPAIATLRRVTVAGYSVAIDLPVNPPVLPMLAKRVSELPPGEGWIYEPKWDGFRTLIFRDGDEVFMQSRDEKPLNRYFPELLEPLKKQLPKRCVLDGELVIATGEALEFDTLQMRLHPAESRVKKLSVEIPASVVFFDILCEGDKSLCDNPFAKRRARLEKILAGAQ